MTGSTFIPGIALSRSFFDDVVQPLIAAEFPHLRYAAGLLGTGSEVLGFDSAMSTDHDWGPRVDLFVEEHVSNDLRRRIDEMLRSRLPYRFRGYATSFTAPDPDDHGTRLPQKQPAGHVQHKIGIQTAAEFWEAYLGVDVTQPIEPADWMTFPEQKLRTISSGPIFRDDIGLRALQEEFAYYPTDVWLYLIAAGWTRIGQEEHLMGRAGIAGDEIGSALIGSRLVRDLMRLCFLLEKVYAPYPKWFGTAFQQLPCAADLTPPLQAALVAATWQDRERQLVRCYERVAAMHNALGITDPVPATARRFFDRPFSVIALNGFAHATAARIEHAEVRRLLDRPLIGSVDQFSDNTDLITNAEWRPVLRRLFE